MIKLKFLRIAVALRRTSYIWAGLIAGLKAGLKAGFIANCSAMGMFIRYGLCCRNMMAHPFCICAQLKFLFG